ncbi:MAG: cation:proton antiporter [candidate division KSB1 bacterium]|jgi:Kef-type K+ transport system membrane component KefB|nr:cation:proton antiporter [candidate division KSB1 bacterium]
MEESNSFAPLLIVIFLAFIVPIILSQIKRIKISLVVGEIMAGIIIGPSLLGLVQEDTILALLSNIGLAFLMFLAGIEINFSMLFPEAKDVKDENEPNPIGIAFVIYALTIALSFPGARLLNHFGIEGNPWILAFILSATSLGVLLPILKERHLLHTRIGQSIFISATLADFLTVILLTIFLIIQSHGLSLEIFSISLLFLAFFIFQRFGSRFTKLKKVRALVEEMSRATVQIKVRGAIAILLAFVVLAEFVEAELILGAFLAGMIIALIKSNEDESLIEKLEAFGFGFFIPVFFIMVGVNLDFTALADTPESLLLLPLLFVLALIVKMVPALYLRRHFSWKESLAGGFLLNTHLSLEIAVIIIGVKSALLAPAAATTITIFAMLTVLTMPLLFGTFAPKVKHERREGIIVCGGGTQALDVAMELMGHGEKTTIMSRDKKVIEKADKLKVKTMLVTNEKLKGAIQKTRAKGLLALHPDDRDNMALCQLATEAGVPHIVARVNDAENTSAYQRMNVQPYEPSTSQVTILSLMVRNPDVLSILTSTSDERDVREFVLQNPAFAGRRLRRIKLPGDLWITSIRRGNQLIIPHANDVLEIGDRLTVLGDITDLEEAAEMLEYGE